MMAPSVTDNPPSRGCSEGDDGEDLSLPPSAGVILNYESDNESESDSESFDNLNSGYELLPQEPDSESPPGHLEAQEDQEQTADGGMEETSQDDQTRMCSGEGNHFEDTSVAATPAASAPPMDQDHINKIKAAMAGFHLPPASIPSWATVVPEEQWKRQLLQRMKVPPGQRDGTGDERGQQASESDQREMPP